MSRLEEIKERSKSIVYMYDGEDVKVTDDVEYLLSRLDIAQYALNQIRNGLIALDSEDFYREVRKCAYEALQQIRE